MFSITQTGNIIVFVSTLFALFGVNIAKEDLEATLRVISGVVALIGAIISWYGRWKVGDLKITGFKK